MKLFNKKKETRSLPMGRKGKSAFAVYTALVLMLCCCTTTAFAASDPLTVINNLSDFIFGLIRAIGMILLGFGVVQIGLSLKSHDPSRRSAADDKRKYGSAGAGRCGPSLTAAGKEVAECPITG